MQRWIMHIDMDAFYASIEQLDHPEWRGKPLVVGGQSDRGVVSAASYEARKYGLHSAMPVFQARRLCPHAIFAPGRMWRYAELSRQVMEVLHGFSPVVEQASIDEAYLDACGLERLFGPVEELGRKVKQAVRERTGLTCSVGLAPVKFLAKIASDLNKPDGLSILYPDDLPDFLAQLPLEKIPGLGRQTMRKIASYGMKTAGDAQKYSQDFWEQRFGKAGKVIYQRCHGIDPRELEPDTAAKSESAENTFEKDTDDREELKTWLLLQAERVGASLRKHGYRGRTITLKIKYADFSQHTKSRSLAEHTDSTRVIYELGLRLLEETTLTGKLRLIGLGVSNFEGENAVHGCNQAVQPDTANNAGPQMQNREQHEPRGQTERAESLTLPGINLKPKGATTSLLNTASAGAGQLDADSHLGATRQGTGQLSPLLPPELDKQREQALDKALDEARKRFGQSAIMRGRLFENKDKRP